MSRRKMLEFLLLFTCVYWALFTLPQSAASVLTANDRTIYGGMEYTNKLPGTINNAEKIQIRQHLPGTKNLAEKVIPESVIRKMSIPPREM